jgi:hypothetical protein
MGREEVPEHDGGGGRTVPFNPGGRRLRYHSYITTVEQEGVGLVITDPLRKCRYIFYPSYFIEVRNPLEECGSGAGSRDRGVKGTGEKG